MLTFKNPAEKKKMNEDQKNQQEQKSQAQAALELENKNLKALLIKQSSDQEALALAKEAEKIAKEEEALKAEANLRQKLGTEFSTVKSGLKDGEELSNEQLIAIMGDAVGEATDAQGKLILSQVASMISKQGAELEKTQKLMIELAAGVTINQARSQYDDYDDYKTEIAGIMSTTRGLSAEDAYMLAKAKKGVNQPNQQRVETERGGKIPDPYSSSQRNEYVRNHEETNRSNEEHVSPKEAFSRKVGMAIDKLGIGQR